MKFNDTLIQEQLRRKLSSRGPLTARVDYPPLTWRDRMPLRIRDMRERIALWLAPWLRQE